MIAYTRHVVVYRRQGYGGARVKIHVDPSDAMRDGQTYDAELVLPASGTPHGTVTNHARPVKVEGIAKGTSSSVGCALPDAAEDHCVVTHVCALRVTIRQPSDAEDVDVHTLPVEIEHRDMGLVGRY